MGSERYASRRGSVASGYVRLQQLTEPADQQEQPGAAGRHALVVIIAFLLVVVIAALVLLIVLVQIVVILRAGAGAWCMTGSG